jgi:hypothetical protein
MFINEKQHMNCSALLNWHQRKGDPDRELEIILMKSNMPSIKKSLEGQTIFSMACTRGWA